MPKLIKDGAIAEDQWQLIATDADPCALPAGNIIVPLAIWQSHKAELHARPQCGVWLNSDESPGLLADDLPSVTLVAINFPAFADGRGFSYARELRQTHQFKGEVRAIGDFIRDQLHYLQRCGFNAFAIETADAEKSLASLRVFSDSYQAAIDQPLPIYKRR